MKLVGITAYGINVRNEANQNLELHDIYMVNPYWNIFMG